MFLPPLPLRRNVAWRALHLLQPSLTHMERQACAPGRGGADTVVHNAAPLDSVAGAPCRVLNVKEGVGKPSWHTNTELWVKGAETDWRATATARKVGCGIQGEGMALRILHRHAKNAGVQGGQYTPLTGRARERAGSVQRCPLHSPTPPSRGSGGSQAYKCRAHK